MLRAFFVFLAGLIAVTPIFASAADRDVVLGTWRNQRNTMHIQMYRCGESICGRVAWANAEAIADAQRGGTTKLIGTEIFRDFHQDAGGNWSGQVFVPDLNRTFSGTILVVDHNTLQGSGCLVGHFLCKAKTLLRIA